MADLDGEAHPCFPWSAPENLSESTLDVCALTGSGVSLQLGSGIPHMEVFIAEDVLKHLIGLFVEKFEVVIHAELLDGEGFRAVHERQELQLAVPLKQ